MKRIVLNEGSQRDFVTGTSRFSAYIGGLGSGKTFAGLARGLKFSQQEKPRGMLHGARGLVAAINYPVLEDVVLPEFEKIVDGTDLVKDYVKSRKKAILHNGAEILFRSLDRPNWMRGLELSWFFIDEGRHLTKSAWEVLLGRLRQPGYDHGGWVCSTPNGYDWMWDLFHEDSPARLDGGRWYGAPTYENRGHLPADYIKSLEASYEGKFFEQEVEGKFVGLMGGAVFPHYDPRQHQAEIKFRDDLPLYSFWDFGIGDLGVVLYAQIEYLEKRLVTSLETEYVPYLYFIGCIESKDRSGAEWAKAHKEWLDRNCNGHRPTASFGDPAGRNRNLVSGTSILDELAAHGVPVEPAQRRTYDFGIVILDNMMAGSRVLVSKEYPRLSAALATYHWPTDDNGNRTGSKPVHDWTSHFCDAARYGAASLLSHFPRRGVEQGPQDPAPNQFGYIVKQILTPQDPDLLGGPYAKKIDWQPGIYAPLGN